MRQSELLGTLDLLEPQERALVRGLIVNRFRGDQRLFDDGRAILEQRSGLPVLGVLPYREDLPVPPEDSQSIDSITSTPAGPAVTVAVVAYPRASNDSAGTEGPARVVKGLGLLPVETVLHHSKTTRRRTGAATGNSRMFPRGVGLCGYEIHTGETLLREPAQPFATLAPDGTDDGAVSGDGLVAGTYLHGLLADLEARSALLSAAATRAGIDLPTTETSASWAELSSWFREAIDADTILDLVAQDPR